jgi:hypothetical protein
MKELSLNILDIAENSLKAGSSLTEITIREDDEILTITVTDNGKGMSEDVLLGVANPFYTSRTTRRVGLGIPLFKMAAEQTGGSLKISSKSIEQYPDSHGTVISATFKKNHIDFTPLGDTVSTVVTLIQGHPDSDFVFTHECIGNVVGLDTRELRRVLEDVPLHTYEVLGWIVESLRDQYDN